MKKHKVIYKCSHIKKKVCLDVKSDVEKSGLFGKKINHQQVLNCDVQSMGACSMRLDRFDTKCPAVAQAQKCTLK